MMRIFKLAQFVNPVIDQLLTVLPLVKVFRDRAWGSGIARMDRNVK